MPGKAFRRLNPSPKGLDREAAFFSLGKTLRHIHQVSQEPFETSSLFEGDRSFEDFKLRLVELFREALTRIKARTVARNLPQTPEAVAKEALARLPKSDDRVALHSNPGPEHFFLTVNPAEDNKSTFSGLIDFGDAYISHPALDLRRWQLPEDRVSLLEGYRSESPLSENFIKTWQVVSILTGLNLIANKPDPVLNETVQQDLQKMLAES